MKEKDTSQRTKKRKKGFNWTAFQHAYRADNRYFAKQYRYQS